MAIDWSKVDELKDEVDGGTPDQSVAKPTPSPKVEVATPATSVTFSPDDDPKLHAAKIAVDQYQKMLKGSSDFVLDTAKHIVTTNPLDTAAGVAELGLEMVSGIAGAGAGAIAGTATALTAGEERSKKLLQDNFGHEDAIINMENVPSSAKLYLAIFNEVSEAMTFEPRSETGKALSGFVQSIFQKFGDWGKNAGDFATEKGLGPEVATVIETVIAGTPYIVPPILAKGNIVLKSRQNKLINRKKVAEKIEELEKEGTLDVLPDTEIILKKAAARVEDIKTDFTVINDSKKVRAVYDKAAKDIEAIESRERKSILQKIQTGVFDVSSEVKQRLLKRGKQIGDDAVMRQELIAGATPRAQLRFQRWEDKIYKDMSKDDFKTINEIIQSRRIIEIDNAKGTGVVRHPGNLTGKDHSNYLIDLNSKLGKDKFNDLWNRTDEYFRATNEVLVDLYTEGLITKEAFNSMKGLVYEPRKFLAKMDPSRPQKLGNQTINVHDSGLHDLSKGAIKSLEQDSRALLSEYIVRAENRIAMNKANITLRDFAELYPDNGWVKAIKTKNTKTGKAAKVVIPEGQVRIDAMINGQVKPLLMDKHMAEQWITQSPQVTANMANLMRVTSGSFIVRPLATGYNPGFAFVNFPRDISHAYFAASEFNIKTSKYQGVFSTNPAIFAKQMSSALAITMKDAWGKKGAFIDFINEGGGMNFLTHQGTESFVTKGIRPKLTPTWRHVKESMSKLNEFSEIWTRLAIREQSLRNGKTPERATYAARSYLDFSQGGRYAKSFDHSIPYLNASIQAFRTTARSAKRNPKEFVTKVAWLQASAASLWLANYYTNPEVLEQISSDELASNWIITTPMSFIDQQGNKRHLYFKIKKDNTMIAATQMVELLLERYHFGRVPDNAVLESFKKSLPVGNQLPLPPTLMAGVTYLSNHDFWTDNEIWKGPDVPSEDEFQIAPRKPTPPFYVDVGKWTGLSPMRTESAVKKLAPQNPYTDLAGMSYKMLTEGLTDFDKSRNVLQILNDTPVLRRIIGITHPASREMDAIEPIVTEGNAVRVDLNRKMDNIYFRVGQGTITGGEQTLRSWINAQPSEERTRLTKRLEGMKTYDRIMSRDTGVQGVPSRLWWVRTNEQDGITRADLFYSKWRSADTKGRQVMERIAGRMSSQGLGYRSDSFNRQFRKNLNYFGRDFYGEGESKEFKPLPRR